MFAHKIPQYLGMTMWPRFAGGFCSCKWACERYVTAGDIESKDGSMSLVQEQIGGSEEDNGEFSGLLSMRMLSKKTKG